MNGDYPHTYKQTRNELSGSFSWSRLSEHLALGTVSVREVVNALATYEQDHGQTESSQWLLYELMWREYFFWMAHKFQASMFRRCGINGKNIHTSYYPERLKAWINCTTQWPLVNACMRELNETGWLSNRGRQIVASCLVNELSVDWRYGAAYFQQQLIDYEVASNWGNWQYIAGVGCDPRGGRHFNLQYQQEQYDPDGHYRRRWLGDDWQKQWTFQDSRDCHDWPVVN
jgi:deoxyribodipyrimidine photo-lyase